MSTRNDGHCHHARMGVFPDPQSNNIEGLARETIDSVCDALIECLQNNVTAYSLATATAAVLVHNENLYS